MSATSASQLLMTLSTRVNGLCSENMAGGHVSNENHSNETEQFATHDASDVNILDAILVRIGEFGRYQMFNYILLCIPMIFNAFQSISYVFTASPVVYRWVFDKLITFHLFRLY